jgi:hypothetical protein
MIRSTRYLYGVRKNKFVYKEKGNQSEIFCTLIALDAFIYCYLIQECDLHLPRKCKKRRKLSLREVSPPTQSETIRSTCTQVQVLVSPSCCICNPPLFPICFKFPLLHLYIQDFQLTIPINRIQQIKLLK